MCNFNVPGLEARFSMIGALCSEQKSLCNEIPRVINQSLVGISFDLISLGLGKGLLAKIIEEKRSPTMTSPDN